MDSDDIAGLIARITLQRTQGFFAHDVGKIYNRIPTTAQSQTQDTGIAIFS